MRYKRCRRKGFLIRPRGQQAGEPYGAGVSAHNTLYTWLCGAYFVARCRDLGCWCLFCGCGLSLQSLPMPLLLSQSYRQSDQVRILDVDRWFEET